MLYVVIGIKKKKKSKNDKTQTGLQQDFNHFYTFYKLLVLALQVLLQM